VTRRRIGRSLPRRLRRPAARRSRRVGAGPDASAAIALDAPPGAVDAGIYLARERGFDEAEGVTLRIRPPTAEAAALRSLLDGPPDVGRTFAPGF